MREQPLQSVSSVKIREWDDYKVHLLKEVAIMEKRQYTWQPESKSWQNVVDGIWTAIDQNPAQAEPSSESAQNRQLVQ